MSKAKTIISIVVGLFVAALLYWIFAPHFFQDNKATKALPDFLLVPQSDEGPAELTPTSQ